MKKYILLTLCVMHFLQSFAQETKNLLPPDTTTSFHTQLLKSNSESDWLLAYQFFYGSKAIIKADSIKAAGIVKFPDGAWAKDKRLKGIYAEKNAKKKESLFKKWLKQFPPEKSPPDGLIFYDYARNDIAKAFAHENDAAKARMYADQVKTLAYQAINYANIGNIFVEDEKFRIAIPFIKKSIADGRRYMTAEKGKSHEKLATANYAGYCNNYALVLYKQKKYREALKFGTEAYKNTNPIRGSINGNYANILIATGQGRRAFDILEEAAKAGQATDEMKNGLKNLFLKFKGYTADYNKYSASVNAILITRLKEEAAKKMIDLPAPDFTLTDLDGTPVSLKDLRGKIVVLDFWATWCVPCKKQFPAMKMALEWYKNDPNVKFLFIHTWEYGDLNAARNVQKYMKDNNYPFRVLMDLQDPATHINKVVTDFKIKFIPSKFIIDKDGHIRFAFSGFSGGDDASAEEVKAMVELTRKETL